MIAPALDLVGIEKVGSVDYLETVLGCYAAGRVAVAIDAGATAPPGHSFAERITPQAGGGWFARQQVPLRDDRPAQISFSSGTTGVPKAVLLANRALADVTHRLITAMEVDGEIREYLGVPATYSFGLGRARVCAAVGGRLFVPTNGFNPGELIAMLESGEINALSAVPTLLRVLIGNPELMPKKAARRLRWLEIGSQPMSVADKQAVRRMFPAARIIQHYGLTEASRSTFLDLQEATDQQLATVGRPIGATEVKIDAEGLICIRGPHLADGILTEQGLTPIVDADGWLHTRDLGSIDADSFLTFGGRADDLLNVGGIKVPADLFERRLSERLGGGDAIAVTSRPDRLRGEIVLIAHTAALAPDQVATEARTVGAEFGLSNADLSVIAVEVIPRTETGKVQRAALTERQAQPIANAPADPPPASSSADPGSALERQIAKIWGEVLGTIAIERNKSFFELGGDSLAAITVVLAMERAGLPKPLGQQVFQDRTIAQIAASEDGDAPFVTIPTSGETAPGVAPKVGPAPPIPNGSRNMNPPGLSLRALIAEDFRANHSDPFGQGFLMLLVHRFGNWRMDVRTKLFRAPLTLLYRFLNKLTQILFGMKLDYVVPIGRRVRIEHFGGIIIGARAIGNDVVLRQNTTFGIASADDMNAKPTIGDFVDIGAGVVIVGNITIGDNSIIAPNSLVIADVPPNSIAMGVPAQIVGRNRKQNRSPLVPVP